MEGPFHALVDAGLRQAAGQHHMHLFKRGTVAMKNGHQIHYRVMAAHQRSQLLRVVHIGLHHAHHGQHLHRPCRQAPCWHRHVHTRAVQRFAHMPSNKTRAT